MAALIDRLRKRAADTARVLLGGGFRHAGVTFQHPGILLDQERAAEVVDKVAQTLAKRGHRPREIEALLARVDVRMFPPRGPEAARVDLHAAWSGGLRDRGSILMRRAEDWPERLGRSLLALLLLELEPGARIDDVPVSVVEEARDA